ncbi:MAG: cyclic nucleotide-binding domain-containing protein [Bdellovibrionales bacterium]
MKAAAENKRIFLIASASPQRVDWISKMISRHISKPTIFTSNDGLDAASKLQNAPPHVLVTDIELPRTPPFRLVKNTLDLRGAEGTAVIVVGTIPEEEQFLDEVVTGKIQYFEAEEDEQEFNHVLVRALNYSSHQEPADFYLRFMAPGEILMSEGDKAENVYFVKKGQLEAFKKQSGQETILGPVEVGEFVGEMAYINGERRSAHVRALSDCELIEVPIGLFDSLLFKRPAWSKALMLTLAKRVKAANSRK